MTKVTSHPPPWRGSLFHLIIMRYYYLTNAQISFSRKPRPPQCSLASLARVPKVTPLKNPRSANELIVGHTTIKYDDPRLKMSHSACDIVRHFQPRVRHSYLLLPYFTVNKDFHNRCVGAKPPDGSRGRAIRFDKHRLATERN